MTYMYLVPELFLVFLCHGHDCFAPLQVVEQTTDAVPEGGGGEDRVNAESRTVFLVDWVGGLHRCPASSNHGR